MTMTRLMCTTKRAALMVGVALVLAGLPGQAAAQSDIALVFRLMLDEQLMVTPAGEDEGRRGEAGERLNNQDELVTTENTRAAIRFTDDGSMVRMNPNSRLTIRADGEPGARSQSIVVNAGELWARVTRRENTDFEVRTSSGVAAVKGTEFLVRVGADGAVMVITLEGALDFFNDTGTMEIPAGYRALVHGMDDPPGIAPYTSADLAGFEAIISGEGLGDSDQDRVDVEIQLEDAQGRIRRIIIEVPRRDLRGVGIRGGE